MKFWHKRENDLSICSKLTDKKKKEKKKVYKDKLTDAMSNEIDVDAHTD